jgi:hypothetical protein
LARLQYGDPPIFPLGLSNPLSTFHLFKPSQLILKLDSIRLHSSSSLACSLYLPSTSLPDWLRARHRVQHSGCKCPALRLDTRPVSPSPGHILRSSPHLPRRDRITDPSRAPDSTVDNVEDRDRLYEFFEIIVLIGRYGVHVVQYVPSCDVSTDHVGCSGRVRDIT